MVGVKKERSKKDKCWMIECTILCLQHRLNIWVSQSFLKEKGMVGEKIKLGAFVDVG